MSAPMIAAFLGSPRPKGNTDTLAHALLDGARESGCVVEEYALRALRVHPCTGCDNCGRAGRLCIFRDDGDALYDAMTRSDLFLFATPVYWYGPTAIMKAFVDRLAVFAKPESRHLVRGKTAVLVAAWEEKGMKAAEPMVRLFELCFEYLELHFEHRLLVDSLGPRDAARGNAELLGRAYAMGRSLG